MPRHPTIDQIFAGVQETTGLNRAGVMQKNRSPTTREARSLVVYLANRMTEQTLSSKELAAELGYQSHTSVLQLASTTRVQVVHDERFRKLADKAEACVRSLMGTPTGGEYPEDWPYIAKCVKDDAAWACVRCRHHHDPPSGHTLTVHHFDGNKSNCERWNLMALCQRCHLSVQARVDPRIPLMFEPATWAMPYIAGMYEAGEHSIPGPLYNLRAWTATHKAERGPWPAWAPRPLFPSETEGES